MSFKPRRKVSLPEVHIAKKPYLVRGAPGMTLFLTDEQATKRLDLIPQYVK